MAKFRQGFTSHAPQTKDQLRKTLADAQRNTQPDDYPVAVKVPDKKRTLPALSNSSPKTLPRPR